jgi:DeoR/GlpR family transcriptional regulator of sugar metabolism
MRRAPRKPSVRVSQEELLAFIEARSAASLWTVIEAFDIVETTARRKLDGLVYQGKLTVQPGTAHRERVYRVRD